MKKYPVTLLEIGLLTGTRATAAAGLALLLAHKLDDGQRKAMGWSLFGIGCAFYFATLGNVLLRNKGTPSADHDQEE